MCVPVFVCAERSRLDKARQIESGVFIKPPLLVLSTILYIYIYIYIYIYLCIYIYPFFSPPHYILPFTKIVHFRGFLRKLSILSHRIVYIFAVGFSLCETVANQLALITLNTKDYMRLYATVNYEVSWQMRPLNVWDSLAVGRSLIAIANSHVTTTSLLTFQ